MTSLNPYWGCFSGNTWNSTVSHLQNVISINLKTEQLNATVKLQSGNTTFDIVYNLNLWACYTSGGCGDQFATFSEYNSNPNIWQQVMKLSEKTVLVDQKKDTTSTDYGKGLSLTLFPNTFQNQESVPTNGLVKSYFISVEFLEDPYSLYTGLRHTRSSSSFWLLSI